LTFLPLLALWLEGVLLLLLTLLALLLVPAALVARGVAPSPTAARMSPNQTHLCWTSRLQSSKLLWLEHAASLSYIIKRNLPQHINPAGR
jgi:hypothetical protein